MEVFAIGLPCYCSISSSPLARRHLSNTSMHDPATEHLAAQLTSILPAGAQPHARPLAQIITSVAAGTALPEVLQSYLAQYPGSASGTAQALAGQTFSAGDTVVSFGSGSNLGDVTIGNAVSGNQFNVNITVSRAGPFFPEPDPLQHAILAHVATLETSGASCFVGDIASSLGHNLEEVADEVELLEQAGYVQTLHYINGTRVKTTAAGRKLIRRTAPGEQPRS